LGFIFEKELFGSKVISNLFYERLTVKMPKLCVFT